jgi:hypothetical protein
MIDLERVGTALKVHGIYAGPPSSSSSSVFGSSQRLRSCCCIQAAHCRKPPPFGIYNVLLVELQG